MQDARIIARTREIVWKETYRGIYPDKTLDEYDLAFYEARDRGRIVDTNQHYYLFFDGDDCIGYFSFGPYHYGTYKDFSLCLNNLYIRNGYKGCGLGKLAFEYVRSFCKENGVSRFFCGCNIHNKPAVDFYKHMGGVAGDEAEYHENKADDILHFEFYIKEKGTMFDEPKNIHSK